MEINRTNLRDIMLEDVRSGISAYKRVLIKEGDIKSKNVVFMNEAYLPAGKEVMRHLHDDLEEIMYVVAGRGKIIMNGTEIGAKKGDRIIIPQNCMHAVMNTGASMMKFLCLGIKL